MKENLQACISTPLFATPLQVPAHPGGDGGELMPEKI